MWWPSGWPLIPSRLFSHLHLLVALVHNSDRGRELAWPRLPSSGHLAIRHPEHRHGVQNLAPDPCLNSLCRQPRRVQKYKRTLRPARRSGAEFIYHYRGERNHQGLGNAFVFLDTTRSAG